MDWPAGLCCPSASAMRWACLLPGTKVNITPYGAGAQLLPAGRTARLVEEDGVLVADAETPVDDDTVFALIDAGRKGRSRSTPASPFRCLSAHITIMRAWCDGGAGGSRAQRSHPRRDILGSHQAARQHAARAADAAQLLNARFAAPFMLSRPLVRKLPNTLSRLGIAGGAVYDALVALAAKEHGAAPPPGMRGHAAPTTPSASR